MIVMYTLIMEILSPCFDCIRQTSKSDVYRRQILTSKVDPRTERLKMCDSCIHIT